MYTIKYGNKLLNDYFSNDDLLIYNVTLSQNKNEFAYLDFEMAYTHPLYKEITPNDINNPIILCDDGDPIFIGYIYEIETDFDLNLAIKCKDVMSFLSQSFVGPYFTSYQDSEPIHPWPKPPSLSDQKDVWPLGLKRVSNLPREYFKFLLHCHNTMVQSQQMILPGHIELPNDRFRVLIKNTQYPTVFDEITDKLLKTFGGFLRMRYEGGVYYLDYLQETFDDPNLLLDFGESILDITRTKNSEELKTYMIPLGASLKDCFDEVTGMYDYVDGYFRTQDTTPKQDKTYYTKSDKKHEYSEWEWKSQFEQMQDGRPIIYYEHDDDTDESEVPLTIDRYPLVNDIEVYAKKIYKKGKMLFDKTMASKHGLIGYMEQNNDIKNIPDLVLWGSQQLIEKTTIVENISIKAVDLKLINNKPVGIGDHVRIRSTKHDIDKFFECIEININISSPENTTYQFGSRLDTLTNSINTSSDYLNSKINKYWDKK